MAWPSLLDCRHSWRTRFVAYLQCRASCQKEEGSRADGAGVFPHTVPFSLVSICYLHGRSLAQCPQYSQGTFSWIWNPIFNTPFACFSSGNRSFCVLKTCGLFGNHKHSQEDQGKLWNVHKWASLSSLRQLRLRKVFKVKAVGSGW